MTPSRVLMTADTLGGVWQFALELARGLSERGVQVTLATLGEVPSDHQRRAARRVAGLALHESAYRLEWMHSPWKDLERAGDWLLELADTVRPDLVHLNHYAHGALDWPAPVLITAHSCVLSWFAAVHGTPADESWRRYRRVVTRGLAGADRVTAPSLAMAQAIGRYYHPPAPIRVIPNGRRAGDFRTARPQPRILAVGRLWDAAKNLEALARCAPDLDWPVRLIGPDRGPDGQTVCLRNVECLPPRDDDGIRHEYAEASIYALPARYEPFGLSALEAALSGCALVLGDIPSLREVWGDAALYVAPDDDAALTATLRRLTADPEACRAWAARAHRRARRYHDAAMSDGYLAAYSELATPVSRYQDA